MNVAVHQEKEKNEKTNKREEGEERKQSTDFKEAACCISAVVQRAARQKVVCVKGVFAVTGTLGKVNCHFDPSQTGSATASPR